LGGKEERRKERHKTKVEQKDSEFISQSSNHLTTFVPGWKFEKKICMNYN
jgi:hypothetical protein